MTCAWQQLKKLYKAKSFNLSRADHADITKSKQQYATIEIGKTQISRDNAEITWLCTSLRIVLLTLQIEAPRHLT